MALKTLERSRGNTVVEQGDASSASGSSSENTAVDLSPLPSRQPVNVGLSSQKTPMSSQNNSVFYPETPKSCAKVIRIFVYVCKISMASGECTVPQLAPEKHIHKIRMPYWLQSYENDAVHILKPWSNVCNFPNIWKIF